MSRLRFLSNYIPILVAAIILAAGFISARSSENIPPATEMPAKTSYQREVSYRGQEDKNALELLKSAHDTKTEDYSGIGEFVTAINGVEADEQHFWALYVNGRQSQVGASDYQTKPRDIISWKLEEIR